MILWCSHCKRPDGQKGKLTPHVYVGLRTLKCGPCIEARCTECRAAGHFKVGKTAEEALAWVKAQEKV